MSVQTHQNPASASAGDLLLRDYARLIVRTGANVQPGQIVQLTISVEQHEFAAMITEEAYLAGAKKVNLNWLSDRQDRLHYQYAEEEVLSQTLPWEKEKLRQMTEDLPVRIFVESEDPDALAGLDPEKLSHVMQKRAAVAKPYRDTIDGKHQWCIAALPSQVWAQKCFPDVSPEAAMSKLREAIYRTVRIGKNTDAVSAWKAHTDRITEKSSWLNLQHFTSLHYSSRNGTDFTVDLIPEALWEGAGAVNGENGVFYIPNMPTEEIFTSPLAGHCEGTLVAVKPLSWNGQLIEDFSITFREGKAISCRAAKGQELLEKMLHMDEGASMLGEVALVPKDSPVNRCGFLFYNTLFDENACCHFALGQGFREVLPNGNVLSSEEATAAGINDSIIHVDFMVGADDLNITGRRADGSSIAIFTNGTWAE